jgi:hypothetical protein
LREKRRRREPHPIPTVEGWIPIHEQFIKYFYSLKNNVSSKHVNKLALDVVTLSHEM